MEFDVSSATVELAAQAVRVEGARIAKTLSFLLGDGCVPDRGGARREDRQQEKIQGKIRRKGEDARARRRAGVYRPRPWAACARLAVKEGVRVYLDESLRRFETVFPACGRSDTAPSS